MDLRSRTALPIADFMGMQANPVRIFNEGKLGDIFPLNAFEDGLHFPSPNLLILS
jgi:hypothetical protein